jgi:cysteinyl-tRNA synthetase
LGKGYAYEKFRSVYFDISRFKDYGKLSRIDLEKIKVGKTVDLERYEKDNPKDFTLLKRSTLKELKKGIFYQTQWGNVRPSWHLECPAMALKSLGDTHDIHTGGVDLIFPHHENAIAVSQAVTGKPFSNYWLHNELLMINGKNPSRSSDDRYTVTEIQTKGYTAREIRYWLMSRHYRKPITFSWTKLETAKNTVHHLDTFTKKLHHCPSGRPHPEMDQLVYNLRHRFVAGMDDDFNIAPALAALFQFTREINRIMDRQGLSPMDQQKVKGALESINQVLGVMDLEPPKVAQEIEPLVKQREKARKAQDWATADRIRQDLRNMGVEVVDTKEGTLCLNQD